MRVKFLGTVLRVLAAVISGFLAVGVMILAAGVLALNFAEPPLRRLGAAVTIVLLFCPLLLMAFERSVLRYLIRPIRTMAEAPLASQGIWPYQGIQEAALRRRLVCWRDASIDSCSYALATLASTGHQAVARGCRPKLEKFVADRFVAVDAEAEREPKLSGFCQSSQAAPTIYASSMAINVWKLVSGVDLYEEPLGRSRATMFEKQSVDLEELIRFVDRCQDRQSGGFRDHPHDVYDERPSIQVTHSACFLLWNLDCLDDYKKSIRDFVFACLPQGYEGLDKVGFCEYPGCSMLTCSTYYALRILQKVGDNGWIEEHKQKLAGFLATCWADGAFKASRRHRRTLVHACLAVAVFLDILHDSRFLLGRGRLEKVRSYIKACQDRYGGFQLWHSAFGLGGRWYAPNLYATYHVVQAVQLLETIRPAFAEVLDMEDISAFVRTTSVEEQEDCVWRGYSIGKSGVEKAVAALSRKVLDPLLMPDDPTRPRQYENPRPTV